LEQLIATQPANYLQMMANDKFFRDKRSRAAAACFVEYLKTSPDDVSARLNMAVAYNRVGMYEEANRAVDYLFEHRLRLGDHGHVVAYESKAVAALGKKEYGKSIQLAEQSFAIDHRPFPLIIVQFAAAQMGDMGKLKAAQQRFEKALPAQYLEMKIHMDAIRAYAMVRNNQLDAAQRLIQPWKDTDGAAGRVRQYWQSVPDGMDVARNFAELIQN
jgi:tetratricopeptide (TPR) repeat protein